MVKGIGRKATYEELFDYSSKDQNAEPLNISVKSS
jgi:hypothetical protein